MNKIVDMQLTFHHHENMYLIIVMYANKGQILS